LTNIKLNSSWSSIVSALQDLTSEIRLNWWVFYTMTYFIPIYETEDQLQFKEAEHDALRKIAAAQDAQIAANERRIAAQEALIAVREAQIATREAQIATRQTQNATQEARIAALEGPLIWEETGIHTVQVLQRSSSNEGRLDA
jgi:hypothetical protein